MQVLPSLVLDGLLCAKGVKRSDVLIDGIDCQQIERQLSPLQDLVPALQKLDDVINEHYLTHSAMLSSCIGHLNGYIWAKNNITNTEERKYSDIDTLEKMFAILDTFKQQVLKENNIPYTLNPSIIEALSKFKEYIATKGHVACGDIESNRKYLQLCEEQKRNEQIAHEQEVKEKNEQLQKRIEIFNTQYDELLSSLKTAFGSSFPVRGNKRIEIHNIDLEEMFKKILAYCAKIKPVSSAKEIENTQAIIDNIRDIIGAESISKEQFLFLNRQTIEKINAEMSNFFFPIIQRLLVNKAFVEKFQILTEENAANHYLVIDNVEKYMQPIYYKIYSDGTAKSTAFVKEIINSDWCKMALLKPYMQKYMLDFLSFLGIDVKTNAQDLFSSLLNGQFFVAKQQTPKKTAEK